MRLKIEEPGQEIPPLFDEQQVARLAPLFDRPNENPVLEAFRRRCAYPSAKKAFRWPSWLPFLWIGSAVAGFSLTLYGVFTGRLEMIVLGMLLPSLPSLIPLFLRTPSQQIPPSTAGAFTPFAPSVQPILELYQAGAKGRTFAEAMALEGLSFPTWRVGLFIMVLLITVGIGGNVATGVLSPWATALAAVFLAWSIPSFIHVGRKTQALTAAMVGANQVWRMVNFKSKLGVGRSPAGSFIAIDLLIPILVLSVALGVGIIASIELSPGPLLGIDVVLWCIWLWGMAMPLVVIVQVRRRYELWVGKVEELMRNADEEFERWAQHQFETVAKP